MGRGAWIDSGIWFETRKLSQQERELYLRLIINDNGNMAGYYKLNTIHLAADMGITFDELMDLLRKPSKYWMFDENTDQVLIPRYTKYNVVRGRQQETRLNAELAKLTPCRLHKEFLKAWVECNGIGSESIIDEKFKRLINT